MKQSEKMFYFFISYHTLHHDTTSPTVKLVGKMAFTDRKSVGNGYCRPTLSVTVSPVGKTLSRPTIFCRPTVRWLSESFPDRHFFTDRHFMPTDKWTAFSFADRLLVSLSMDFSRPTVRHWLYCRPTIRRYLQLQDNI